MTCHVPRCGGEAAWRIRQDEIVLLVCPQHMEIATSQLGVRDEDVTLIPAPSRG